MAGYGWNYLVVTHDAASTDYRSSDGTVFRDEQEMLQELGITGWELLFVREPAGQVIYYWRRPRT